MDQNPANLEYQAIIDKYKQSLGTTLPKPPEPIETILPPPPIIPLTTPKVVTLPDKPHPAMVHAANFFKLTALVSFILFCLVFGKIFYNLYRYQNIKIPLNTSLVPTGFISPQPTIPPAPICVLNDQSYQLGQSFLAADGCNTCSCQADGSIVCTQMSCPSATTTPTIKAKK